MLISNPTYAFTCYSQTITSLFGKKHFVHLCFGKTCSCLHRVFPVLKILQESIFQPLKINTMIINRERTVLINIALTVSLESLGSLYGRRSGFLLTMLSEGKRTFKQSKNRSKFLMNVLVSTVSSSP